MDTLFIKRKAVLIGLNYPNTGHSLNGCWNDVDLTFYILSDKHKASRFPIFPKLLEK